MWLFSYFYFEWNYDVLKSKSPSFFLNKNTKFNKNKKKLLSFKTAPLQVVLSKLIVSQIR